MLVTHDVHDGVPFLKKKRYLKKINNNPNNSKIIIIKLIQTTKPWPVTHFLDVFSLTQLVWTMHNICKVRGSNLDHHKKRWF